jgi:hypothetical protein
MKTQVGTEVRDMTPEEEAAHVIAMQESEEATQRTIEKEQARRLVLIKLGLTEDEAKALLGI